MRGFQLARVAAKAELLRIRLALRRQVIRCGMAAGAVVFLLFSVAWLHVAGGMALAERMTPLHAVLVLAGVDAVIAIILVLVAARDVPGPAEREALRVRRLALDQAVETVVLATLLSRLRRVRSVRDLFGVVVGGIVAVFVGARR